jgi:hypothetical protein
MKEPSQPVKRSWSMDLFVGFLWSIVIAMLFLAPGVFSSKVAFIYANF